MFELSRSASYCVNLHEGLIARGFSLGNLEALDSWRPNKGRVERSYGS